MKIFVIGLRGIPNIQGGVEKHCQDLYPLLVKYGLNITVIARKKYFPFSKPNSWKGVNIIYLNAPKHKALETIVHSFYATIIAIIKKPDIAHYHNMGSSMFLPLAKLFGIKTVFTYHSINYYHQKWGFIGKTILKLGEYFGMKYADKIIVVSKTTKDFLEIKFNRKNLEIIPNGVDLPQIVPPGETLKKYQLIPKKYIFTACRFTPEKGVIDLIEAYKKIPNPDYKLVIAGAADHPTKYSKKIENISKTNKNILLTGFISGKPLSELYSNTGLFVLPSHYEGLPIAFLEALSYGIPVLATDIAQNREIAVPAYRFYKTGSIDELAKRIPKLFKISISDFEINYHKRLLFKEYNWDNIAKRTYNIYNS